VGVAIALPLVCMEKVTAIVSPRLLGGAFHLFFDVQTSF
jgi:hypothetical protein